jgi:glycosyltransferase involved in cell wall biosynthesis
MIKKIIYYCFDNQPLGNGAWVRSGAWRVIMIAKGANTDIPAQSSALSNGCLDDPAHELPGSQGEHAATLSDFGTLSPNVSVVIPALNEARNLPHVFAKLPDGLHEVIVVDGNSVDGTVATARQLRPDVRIVIQNRSGKGNALACGFAAATGDIIAMVDADGSADPAEIPQFVNALLDGADFAKGTRFADGGGSCDITRLRRLGNRMLSGLVNLLCGTSYSDLCYGYNVFWRRHVSVFGLDVEKDIPTGGGTRLWGDGFEVETLINIRISKADLKVKEVASYEHSRIHGVSNLNAASDGWRVLRTILAESYYQWRRTAKSKKRIRGLRYASSDSRPQIGQPHPVIPNLLLAFILYKVIRALISSARQSQ